MAGAPRSVQVPAPGTDSMMRYLKRKINFSSKSWGLGMGGHSHIVWSPSRRQGRGRGAGYGTNTPFGVNSLLSWEMLAPGNLLPRTLRLGLTRVPVSVPGKGESCCKALWSEQRLDSNIIFLQDGGCFSPSTADIVRWPSLYLIWESENRFQDSWEMNINLSALVFIVSVSLC